MHLNWFSGDEALLLVPPDRNKPSFTSVEKFFSVASNPVFLINMEHAAFNFKHSYKDQSKFDVKQIIQIGDCTYRQLNHWTDEKLFRPDRKPTTGGMGERTYTEYDAFVMSIIGACAGLISFPVTKKIAKLLWSVHDTYVTV